MFHFLIDFFSLQILDSRAVRAAEDEGTYGLKSKFVNGVEVVVRGTGSA